MVAWRERVRAAVDEAQSQSGVLIADGSGTPPGSDASLVDRISYALTHYEDAKAAGDWEHPVVDLISTSLPAQIRTELTEAGTESYAIEPPHIQARGSVGKGKMADIPWIVVFDSRVADSPKSGLYVVYLFDTVNETVYLTFNQGMTDLKEEHGINSTRKILAKRAEIIRSQLGPEGFTMGSVELPESLLAGQNRFYGDSTICYRAYDIGEFPSENEVIDDLARLVAAYQRLIDDGTYQSVLNAFDADNGIQHDPASLDGEGPILSAHGGTYDGITDATEDVRARITASDAVDNWLGSLLVEDVVGTWTDVLRRNDIVAPEIDPDDVPVYDRLLSVYEANEQQLDEQAEALGAGQVGDLTPGQTLFVVLVRDLQEQAGERPNFNHEVMHCLLEGNHRTQADPLETRPDPPTKGATIRRQLTQTGQLIFHGPPGTGKTYTAREFARWWLGQACEEPTEEQLEVVTFHPSFTYEDFIEGLTAKERDGTVEYRVEDGVFKRMCRRAKTAYEAHIEAGDPDAAPPYVLIIDEINRGNLAEIFGEVITLLERDKRLDAPSETATTLPHSGDRFVVPPNLYLIGTMNTADRSIALVDAALRRRFRFLHFPPSMEAFYETYGITGEAELRRLAENTGAPGDSLLALSILALDRLNTQIRGAPELGRGKQLGHSYLLGIDRDASATVMIEDLVDRWQFEVLPLLEEYYFGQFDEIEATLFDGDAGPLLDTEVQEIGSFSAEELASVLLDLVGIDDVEWTWDRDIASASENTGDDELFGPDTRYRMEYLFEVGAIEAGDELQFDLEKLDDERLDGGDLPFDPESDYWRCSLTGNSDRQERVRWNHDNELYSISGLTGVIWEDVTGEDRESFTGPQYWRLPAYPDHTLFSLRDAIREGEIVLDEQPADDD
jgi:5-methylcytosine-specific restriction protein B